MINRDVGSVVGISRVLCCLKMRRSELTALGSRGGRCLVAVLSPFYCPHQSIGVWMGEKRRNRYKNRQEKAFGVRRRGRIRGGHGLETGAWGVFKKPRSIPVDNSLGRASATSP